MILAALVEGNSINATTRMCRVSKLTILRLLADVGQLCRDYHDIAVRGLTSDRIQVDEIWSFVGCKQRQKDRGGVGDGDAWTWVAIDADSKLVVSYLVGGRDAGYARMFLGDVADRLINRVQLTSDGHRAYLEAVRDAFGGNVDYGQLVKIYGNEPNDHRYSQSECIGCERRGLIGFPDAEHISTSYVERQNLTLRMHNRRFTRLTNAISKKIENHEHAIALHYFYYNFCRKHISLKGETPAMAAALTNRVWTIDDLVRMLETEERKTANGGRINREDRM